MSPPRLASAAALPLFASLAWVALSLIESPLTQALRARQLSRRESHCPPPSQSGTARLPALPEGEPLSSPKVSTQTQELPPASPSSTLQPPASMPVMLAGIAAYCAALLLHISFYIATPLFLWGAMCYLMRQNYLKNLLWTALCMGFIALFFEVLFNISLP
jgi:hypothetical protein